MQFIILLEFYKRLTALTQRLQYGYETFVLKIIDARLDRLKYILIALNIFFTPYENSEIVIFDSFVYLSISVSIFVSTETIILLWLYSVMNLAS